MKDQQPGKEFGHYPSDAGGVQYKGGRDMEVQDPEVGSWVTVKRWGRGNNIREASPELVHPNKYVKLH